MNQVDLEGLERLAKEATVHVTGNWHLNFTQTCVYAETGHQVGPARIADIRGWGFLTGAGGLNLPENDAFAQQKAWAAFIAAANPQTVLSLISLAREAEQAQVAVTTAEGEAFLWRQSAEQLANYAAHDDDCTVNLYPGHDACSCGLGAVLQSVRHRQALSSLQPDPAEEPSTHD